MRASLARRFDMSDPQDQVVAELLGNGTCHLCDNPAAPRKLGWLRGATEPEFYPIRLCESCAVWPPIGSPCTLLRAVN